MCSLLPINLRPLLLFDSEKRIYVGLSSWVQPPRRVRFAASQPCVGSPRQYGGACLPIESSLQIASEGERGRAA